MHLGGEELSQSLATVLSFGNLSSGFTLIKLSNQSISQCSFQLPYCRRSSGKDQRVSPLSLSVCQSVEAFASVLVPVAVGHQAHHDEEETAQHREERHEEDGDATHLLFLLIES